MGHGRVCCFLRGANGTICCVSLALGRYYVQLTLIRSHFLTVPLRGGNETGSVTTITAGATYLVNKKSFSDKCACQFSNVYPTRSTSFSTSRRAAFLSENAAARSCRSSKLNGLFIGRIREVVYPFFSIGSILSCM